MEEQTGFNGFTPSEYANGLYRDAKVNSQRRDRLQRRLDNLEKHCRENPVSQTEEEVEVDKIKRRMYSVGISYYATRADYCYRKAELEFRRQEKQSIQNPKQFWKYWEIKQQSIKYTDYEQGNELGHIRSDKGNQRV